jgi:hypothetical protein
MMEVEPVPDDRQAQSLIMKAEPVPDDRDRDTIPDYEGRASP